MKNLEPLKSNILISSAGTGNAFATAEAIVSNFSQHANLFLTDINPPELVSSATFTKNFTSSPLISDQSYKAFMLRHIESNNINICFPFVDHDILELCKWQESNELDSKIYIPLNNILIAEICSDKYKTYHWLKENDLPTPETYLLDDLDLDMEYLIKPRSGFGSTVQKLTGRLAKQTINSENFIAQELCTSPEITIDVFNDKSKKQFRYLCRERIETRAGVCTKAKIFINPELEKLARVIADKLSLSYFCFQVMIIDEQWVVTDINPRYGAGTAMCSAVGMDFYSAMIADVLELEPEIYFSNFNSEAYVTRQYRNILFK